MRDMMHMARSDVAATPSYGSQRRRPPSRSPSWEEVADSLGCELDLAFVCGRTFLPAGMCLSDVRVLILRDWLQPLVAGVCARDLYRKV